MLEFWVQLHNHFHLKTQDYFFHTSPSSFDQRTMVLLFWLLSPQLLSCCKFPQPQFTAFVLFTTLNSTNFDSCQDMIWIVVHMLIACTLFINEIMCSFSCLTKQKLHLFLRVTSVTMLLHVICKKEVSFTSSTNPCSSFFLIIFHVIVLVYFRMFLFG